MASLSRKSELDQTCQSDGVGWPHMTNPLDMLLDQFVADAVRTVQTMTLDAVRVALGQAHRGSVARPTPQPATTDHRRRTRRAVVAPLAERIVAVLREAPGQTIG